MKALDELVDSRAFHTGDYYWAESMKHVLKEKWGQAEPSE
jgi:hypothetical protein